VRSFLLLEEPGPWGVVALRDARLPDGLGSELSARCTPLGIRPLLIRRARPNSRALPDRPDRRGPDQLSVPRSDRGRRARTVIAAYTDPRGSWVERATVTDLREVLDLDLQRLASGVGGLLERSAEPVFAVCVHGRHDACCAERGRPVLHALAEAEPEATWGVSHVGGDRFSANLLILGDGLYYGGLDPTSAVQVAARHREGRLDLRYLRGRSAWPMPVQAAEIALRTELGMDRLGGVAVVGVRRSTAEHLVKVRLRVADEGAGASDWEVPVVAHSSEPVLATCGSARIESLVQWHPRPPERCPTPG